MVLGSGNTAEDKANKNLDSCGDINTKSIQPMLPSDKRHASVRGAGVCVGGIGGQAGRPY